MFLAVQNLVPETTSRTETYTVNRLGEPEGAALLPPGTSPLAGLPNRWPDIRGFSAAFWGYYAEMERLAADLMRLFAIALDLEEHWFDDKTDKHMSNLVANYYHTEEAKEMGRAFNSKQDPDSDKFYR